MSFDNAALNYFFSSDHKEGFDLDYCKDYFSNYTFDKLLDVATATGHFTKVFNAKLTVATDISFNMLKTAKMKNNLENCINCKAENLPFKNKTFDIVTCRIALHHFRNPREFFNETHRVLQKNGFFVLIDSIVDIEDAYLNVIEFVRDNSHFRSYTINEILEFANDKFRLLTFQTQFKRHNFKEWATRLNQDEKTFLKIKESFMELPEKIKEELRIEFEDGKIISYTDKKGIFIFQAI